MKRLIGVFIAFFVVFAASAHAVFIETSLNGIKGTPQEVKIVYGESDEFEPISNWWWYKSGAVVTLTLTKPDGTKETLATSPQRNCLLATFTPTQDGVYQITLQYDTERNADAKTQYQINANAAVQVGKSKQGNSIRNIQSALCLYTNQDVLLNNKTISLVMYENGKPAAKSYFQVISPTGWGRWLETNDNGIATFTPEWTGKYYVEGNKKEKVQGQPFEEYSRSASYSFEVK